MTRRGWTPNIERAAPSVQIRYIRRIATIQHTRLPAGVKHLLATIAAYADQSGACYPSTATLGRAMSMARASVHKFIKLAIEEEVLERTSTGGRTCAAMRLRDDKLLALADQAAGEDATAQPPTDRRLDDAPTAEASAVQPPKGAGATAEIAGAQPPRSMPPTAERSARTDSEKTDTQDREQIQQQQNGAAAVLLGPELVSRLEHIKADAAFIEELASKYTPYQVRGALDRLRSARRVDTPCGWIRRALERNFVGVSAANRQAEIDQQNKTAPVTGLAAELVGALVNGKAAHVRPPTQEDQDGRRRALDALCKPRRPLRVLPRGKSPATQIGRAHV